MVDGGRMELWKVDGLLPDIEAFGQVVVDEEGLFLKPLGVGHVAKRIEQLGCDDGIDLVLVEPQRIERRIGLLEQHDRGVERIAQPRFA